MKGKYANAAEKRRAQEELERRALDAECERDRLIGELARLREAADSRETGLRRQLAEMGNQRDDATAPRISQLEQINNRLRAERGAYRAMYDHEIKEQLGVTGRFTDLLISQFGLGSPEARELIDAVWNAPLSGERHISGVGVHGKDPRLIEAVHRTRGLRGTRNQAHDVAPNAEAVLYDRGQMKAAIRGATDALIEASTPVYSYDGEQSSLAVSAPHGWLEVCIEEVRGLAQIEIPPGERARLVEAILQAGDEGS